MITTTQTRYPQVLKCVIAWCETKQMFKIDCYLFQKCDLYRSERSCTGSIPSFFVRRRQFVDAVTRQTKCVQKQTIRNTVKFYHDNVTLSFRIRIELTANIINYKLYGNAIHSLNYWNGFEFLIYKVFE